MDTALLDQVRVAQLAATVDDMTKPERRALRRVAERLEAELHRQTSFNRYLIDGVPLWVWPAGVVHDESAMFALPDQVWITPCRTRYVLAHAHADVLEPARIALGDPERTLRAVWCTHPPVALQRAQHPKGCVCRGIGLARHLRPDVLDDNAPWLRLSEALSEADAS